MGGVQVYNPIEGFNRMVSDVEGYIGPIVQKMGPLVRLLSVINIYLIIVGFTGMMAYLLFVRQHSVMNKLRRPTNYFAAMVLLGIYLFLSKAAMRLGINSVGQQMTLSLDFIVMPMAVKLLGPIVGCMFGMIQYGASFLVRGELFHISYMLVAGISAMIYGVILYQHKTRYLRCFMAKIIVNLICNVLLVPFLSDYEMTPVVASIISNTIVMQVLLAPVQAFAIYISLIVMRKIRKILAAVEWSL